ncbi:ABC-2 transporter permease [Furfurilactobacillus entadae]|uniref:hypothetical protein n=1 Tax=Furfurilactobacillus entadae TaxID=2922307 RepID=UPI0035F03FEC
MGDFGTWLITILLVVQLSAAAGLYPVELTSNYARIINPYLPMTYLIDGLRQGISLNGGIGVDVLMLLGALVLANGLIIVKYAMDRRKSKVQKTTGKILKAGAV